MKDVIDALKGEPLVQDVAELYKLSAERFLTSSLRILASRLSREMSESEVLAMCSLMKRYHLDPFAGHLYLQETFEGPSSTIRPVLKIDGWLTMLNGQDQFDGLEFTYSDQMIPNPLDTAEDAASARQVPAWMEASIFRKDRSRPTVVREYFLEVYQDTESWRAMGCRQLRHKTIIQCSRVAFGLGGLFDEDDISRMLGEKHGEQADGTTVQSAPGPAPRACATTLIKDEGADGEALPSSPEADDELLAATFGDGQAEAVVEQPSPDDGDSAGLDREASAESTSEMEAEAQEEPEEGGDAISDESEPMREACDDTRDGTDQGPEGLCSQDVLEQRKSALSEQELAMAEKIISEFAVRIRGAGDAAMQEKAVSLSLKWVVERAEAGKLSEPVAQYIQASVHVMFPEMVSQAA